MGHPTRTAFDLEALQDLLGEDAHPFLQFLLDRVPAAVAILDADMRYLAVSQRWYSDYGLDGDPIIGRSHYDVFPDIPERWKDLHRRCLSGETLTCDEDEYVSPGAPSVWIKWEIVPFRDREGNVAGMIMLTEVITRRVRAESAWHESERSLMLAQQAAHIGSWQWDLRADRFECSPEMCRLIGIEPEEQTYRVDDLVARVHPDDIEYVASRVAGVRSGEEPHPVLEARVARADGAVVSMRLVIWADRDEAGTPVIVNGVIQDVTEQRKAEQEAAFRNRAIDTAASPLAITDLEGRFVYANRAFVSLVGYDTADQVVGVSSGDLIVSESPVRAMKPLLETGRWTGEIRLRRVDGDLVDVSIYAALVTDDRDRPYRVVVTYLDITERKQVMQELSRRESQLRQAQELARLGPWRYDVARRLYHVPAETRQVLGLGNEFSSYGPEQLSEWIHPEDLAMVRAVTLRVMRGEQERAELQYRYVSPNRGVLHVRVIMGSERASDGTLTAISGLIQDVTSFRELQEAHKETERALSALMSNLSGLVYRCRLDENWTMQFLSGASSQVLGYAPDELIDNRVISYNDVIDPRDRQRVWEGIHEAVARRQPFQLSYRVIRKNGDLRWVLEQGSAIRDAQDRVESLEGYIADITQEQRIVERLQESEARTRAIMEAASVALITTDEYGNIESFNPEAERIFGYSADEVTGRNLTLLMPDPERARHDRYMARYRDGDGGDLLGRGPREMTGMRKSGENFPVDIAINALSVGDRKLFIGSLRDLTERKKAEARLTQAQKMETVGQLVGGVSHDFNNLLMAMQLNLELANMLAEDRPDISESITVALNAVDRGAELTRRLLAFSRQQPLVPKVIDVNETVTAMIRLLHRLLREDIETHTKLAPDLHPVEVDPAQLETALVNLVVNARDAMGDGGRLLIETQNLQVDGEMSRDFEDIAEGEYVMVAVTDTGEGMSADTLAKAFDPFFTTKEVGKGSGLGLSMVYGYVKQSGGHVRIYSEVGEGTTIKLVFPRSFAGVERPVPQGAPVMVRPGTETVLLVEDDSDVRLTVERLLKSLGYQVIPASDGPSAVALIDEGLKPDLLLADVVLPKGMSGRDVSVAVAERVPGCRILFMSGYTEDAVMHQGRLDEGVVLLSKPFPRELLAKKVRELLDAPAAPPPGKK